MVSIRQNAEENFASVCVINKCNIGTDVQLKSIKSNLVMNSVSNSVLPSNNIKVYHGGGISIRDSLPLLQITIINHRYWRFKTN